MAIQLPFRPQETRYSCVPACLRMILEAIGIVVDEATLRVCCNADRMGTAAKDVLSCVSSYDLQALSIQDATTEELSIWLSNEQYVIAYLNMFPIDAIWVIHAVVIEAIGNNLVTLIDPIAGRRNVSADSFEQAWQMSKRQVIVVRPTSN